MNAQTEQITATQTVQTTRASLTSQAITEIKEQVQLDRWQKQIEERQLAGLSIRGLGFLVRDAGVFGAYVTKTPL